MKPEYWVAHTSGFMDMREARGPFATAEEAESGAKEMATSPRNGMQEPADPAGKWFAIHQDSANYSDSMVMVDGPYDSRDRAEEERQKNVTDEQAFEIDCNEQTGFIARVVKVLPHFRAVMVRE